MTTDLCFKCSNEDSILCTICGIARDGAREYFKQKPITNADKIRSMSDEELAKWIVSDIIEPKYHATEECEQAWLDWLKEEAT